MKLSIVLLFSLLWVSVSVGMDATDQKGDHRKSMSNGRSSSVTQLRKKWSKLKNRSSSTGQMTIGSSQSPKASKGPQTFPASPPLSPRGVTTLKHLCEAQLPEKHVLSFYCRMKSRHEKTISSIKQTDEGWTAVQQVGNLMYVIKSKAEIDEVELNGKDLMVMAMVNGLPNLVVFNTTSRTCMAQEAGGDYLSPAMLAFLVADPDDQGFLLKMIEGAKQRDPQDPSGTKSEES